MTNFLILLIVLLLIILGAVLILFHRQGLRLKEEIQHAINSEDIKSHYLEDVSVTFQEPLKNIIQNCERIESMPCFKEHPDVVNAIEDIRFQSQQLSQYASEMLEMSNTQGNISRSSKIQVNLIELIMSYRREILHDVKENVQVNIRTELSPHIKVWLDTTMFRQLIMHLLRTAAEHTDEGSITIRYAEEKKGLRFWVENTCPPLPKEVLETMFTAQVDPDNQERGTDDKEIVMSMALSKAIIDKMNGEISATSKTTDFGNLNIITFWIPCVYGE
jgi:signal transduction histidine kinase